MIHWESVQVKDRTTILLDNITLHLQSGQSLGIIGPNGSGKTVLAKALAGKLPSFGKISSEAIKAEYVSFQSEFQLKHGAQGYRQQRWNSFNPEFIPTVREEFNKVKNQQKVEQLVTQFNFKHHLRRFVISLSNGEQRKFELIKVLASDPDLLLIDNAFNGLDKASRLLLAEMLNKLVDSGRSVILTGLKAEDFPIHFRYFLSIDENGQCTPLTREELPIRNYSDPTAISKLPKWENSIHEKIIQLNNLHLEFGGKTILKNINWEVNAGECWVLSGGNGSGKTSLLNMIFADNPHAYLCDIRLFGKKKGSGESIWDIKNQIGFVSPEMHQYLPGKQSVNDVICSGFFVSEGLYQKPGTYLRNLATQWLNLIGLKEMNNNPFGTLSASAQRMVLVLRALVKNPPLILLDEPFQGLDARNIDRMKLLLNTVAQHTNCAMIFVTHYEDEIPASFNYELKLHNGEIEYIGKRN